MSERRFIVVSNRLPLTFKQEAGETKVVPSSGGLVTALRPILEGHSASWVGWTGTDYDPEVEKALSQAHSHLPYELVPIYLTEPEKNNFYFGFSNEIIWPLFHDLQSRCNFEPDYWDYYESVNQRYAEAVARFATREDLIWVHDYHLVRCGVHLRQLGLRSSLAYFHHIPFPPPDIFEKLPWRAQFLEGLLSYDVVGFQTERDRRNFGHCVQARLPGAVIRRSRNRMLVQYARHSCAVGAFPISIDFDEFDNGARARDVAEEVRRIRGDLAESRLIVGVDRLDYTKGIPERLKAFRVFLETYPELRRSVRFVQVVVPSREDIGKYQDLKLEVERLVSEINGQFSDPGWVPIHFIYRHLSRVELLGLYRAADVALITPLKDGMNLVAKEFCAAQVDRRGVLILSEFAGAASQLKEGALLVNPNDAIGVAAALQQAFQMDNGEKHRRMSQLRRAVSRGDVHRWAQTFLAAAAYGGPLPEEREDAGLGDPLRFTPS